MKYQLKITRTIKTSARKFYTVPIIFTWEYREDAIECKKLINKSSREFRDTKIEFLEHMPDKPLI